MDFSEALQDAKDGQRIARTGWNGKGLWVAIRSAEDDTFTDRDYLFIHTVEGQFVPWVASQTDLLAEDWILAN